MEGMLAPPRPGLHARLYSLSLSAILYGTIEHQCPRTYQSTRTHRAAHGGDVGAPQARLARQVERCLAAAALNSQLCCLVLCEGRPGGAGIREGGGGGEGNGEAGDEGGRGCGRQGDELGWEGKQKQRKQASQTVSAAAPLPLMPDCSPLGLYPQPHSPQPPYRYPGPGPQPPSSYLGLCPWFNTPNTLRN